MKKINREQFAEELKLRQYIRKAIKIIENRRNTAKKQQFLQEERLRGYIRHLIAESGTPDPEESPHRSTGINILEDLLKKIIPLVEIDFKKLTTDLEQRSSYRAHMIQGVKNLITPPAVMDKAGYKGAEFIPISEEIDDITVSIDPENEHPDDFIDISKEKKSPEEGEKEEFSIEGTDETGRDMA